MGLFRKNKKLDGWVAIVPSEGGMYLIRINRNAGTQPVVQFAQYFEGLKLDQDKTLEKVGKELDLGSYAVTTLLAANEYQFLSVDAPTVPQEELKVAMRWKLKDMLDYHVEDATIDVLEVPTDKGGAARNRTMYAVAARNQVIEQKQNAFVAAKLPLSAIDVPEMAQRNIAALFEPAGRGIGMLSFGAQGGLLTVSSGGELYLSRRIDVPMVDLSTTDQDRRHASFERIALEVQRSLDHFDRQFHYVSLSGLRLAPMPAGVQSLAEFLSSNLYMPIEKVDLATVMDLESVPLLKSLESQNKYFLPLGAALRLEEKTL